MGSLAQEDLDTIMQKLSHIESMMQVTQLEIRSLYAKQEKIENDLSETMIAVSMFQ